MPDLIVSSDIDTLLQAANNAAARTALGLGTLATQSGTFSGTSSGTNTGDNSANSLYSGLVTNATHAGDATGATTLTLATVNANVGSFGSATQASQVTVNAKGLVTAAANVTVTPAIGSVTGLGTGVASALAVNVGTAGAPIVNGGALGTPSSGTATNITGLPIVAGTTGTLTFDRGGTGLSTLGAALQVLRVNAGETALEYAAAGSGSVATDTIWDAAADLVVGTGSDTAARLAKGTSLQVLRVNAGATALEWASPAGGGDALVANPLSQFAATTSLQLKDTISDETGSGALVFANTPTLVTPLLGTPTSGVLTNCTGLPTAGLVDAAVTLGKLADMATASVYYRKTGGTGVPEVQTVATLKTDLGLTGTNSGDQATITFTNFESGGTYVYHGGNRNSGAWAVYRYDNATVTRTVANVGNNGATPDLATAWTNRATINYA